MSTTPDSSKLDKTTIDIVENPFLLYHPQEFVPSELIQDVNFTSISEATVPSAIFDRQLQNVMDCILPPKLWSIDGGVKCLQKVSTAPVTRCDMALLEERFDVELNGQGAKKFGICSVRRQLYDQLLEELIRQTTVSCAERGLLMLRVRDEIRMTLLAYENLLESSIAYGLRKALKTQSDESRAMSSLDEEKAKNRDLTTRLIHLEKRLGAERASSAEELVILEQRMREEKERLLDANKTLKNQIQTILKMENVVTIMDNKI